MGAVTFSLDRNLLDLLLGCVQFTTFFETGTYLGATVREVRGRVPAVISVECDPHLAAEAAKEFDADPGVRIICNSAARALRDLRPFLEEQGVLFWLDAHWCATPDGSEPAEGQCDLISEVEAIGRLSMDSVVLIDDARLFLAPPHAPHDAGKWPRFQEVLEALAKASTEHQVAVVNDVIAFFPPSLAPCINEYALKHGIDWLSVAEKARGYDVLLADNVAKERVIREIAGASSPVEESPVWIEFDRWRERAEAQSTEPRGVRVRVGGFGSPFARKLRSAPLSAVYRGHEFVSKRLTSPFALEQYSPRPPRLPRNTVRSTSNLGGPDIAVVMPSFNQGRFVEESIRSVVGQRYQGLQFVIQDGESGDGSVEVIDRYREHLTYVSSEPDAGQADAINRAFSRTDTEIMGWLNSDDLLLPGALRSIGDYFARHPEIDVVYGSRLVLDEGGLEVGRWMVPSTAHDYLEWADYVPQETLYWRRSLWERVGAELDASMKFALDWELLLRFVDAGAQFACLPRVLGAFRVHRESKTIGSIADVGAEEMRVIRQRRHGRDVTAREISANLMSLYAKAWRVRLTQT